MTFIDSIVAQYSQQMSDVLTRFDDVIKRFENTLIKEEADADRLVVLEEMGTAAANGSINLTPKIWQPTLITGFLIVVDTNATATLTIDRYSQVIKNTQTTQNVIAPVQYVLGPGQKLQVSWTATLTATPYFAAYGKLIGSRYA